MARDRKRAKQRRDRRDRRPVPPRGGLRTDTRRTDEEPEELEAPEPLEHASAEVDLAEAQLAVGRPELAAGEPPISDEELLEAEQQDEAEHPVTTRAAAARGQREIPGNRVVAFIQGSWRELQRVQWPDRRQVAQATGVVIVFVIVAGLFLGLVDALSQKLVDAIL